MYGAIVFSLLLSFRHIFAYNTRNFCLVQIYTQRGAKSCILNCKPVQEHSYRCLAIPNIYTITTFV